MDMNSAELRLNPMTQFAIGIAFVHLWPVMLWWLASHRAFTGLPSVQLKPLTQITLTRTLQHATVPIIAYSILPGTWKCETHS